MSLIKSTKPAAVNASAKWEYYSTAGEFLQIQTGS